MPTSPSFVLALVGRCPSKAKDIVRPCTYVCVKSPDISVGELHWRARAHARTHLGAQPFMFSDSSRSMPLDLKPRHHIYFMYTANRTCDESYTANCQRWSRVLSRQSIAKCYQTLHSSRSARFGSARPSLGRLRPRSTVARPTSAAPGRLRRKPPRTREWRHVTLGPPYCTLRQRVGHAQGAARFTRV